MDFLQNHRNHYIKKNIFEILKERFSRNENLLDRMLHYIIITEKDIKDLNQFVADIYEVAYLRCVEDHKKKFEELGYQVKVTADHSKDGV